MKLSLTEQLELEKRYALTHVVPLELEGWNTYWFGRLGLNDVPIPIKIQAKGVDKAWEQIHELDTFNARSPEGFVLISRADLRLLTDHYVDYGPGEDGSPEGQAAVKRAEESLRRHPEDDEMRRLRFLHQSLKPEEIGNDAACQPRIRELLRWFDRFIEGNANGKWFRQHTYELLHFIASGRRLE
jgi:hypothetical protein